MVRRAAGRQPARDRDRQPRGARALRPAASSPASCSSMSSARPGTMSSNTRSTRSAMPEAAATARCPAPTTPMPGRPTAMPGCRRRRPASGSSCGSRTAIRRRSRPARSGSTRWARSSVVAADRADRALRQPRRRCRRAAAGSRLAAADRDARRQACRAAALRGRRRRAPPHRACQCRARRSAPDPELPRLAELLGKGYLLPAPVLPRERVGEPAAADADGDVAERAADRRAGLRRRGTRGWRDAARPAAARHATALDLDDAAGVEALRRWLRPCRAGLRFRRQAASGDGWLHALFRYRHRDSGHAAETSFGAHVFNTILTYRGEPQSYAAGRRACRRGCSCGSATAATTRCAT